MPVSKQGKTDKVIIVKKPPSRLPVLLLILFAVIILVEVVDSHKETAPAPRDLKLEA